MATAPRPTAPLTERDLDNVCFLDWVARLSGYWQHPDHRGTCRVELDRGAVLRVTNALDDEPYPLTLVDLLEQGHYCNGLTVRRLHPLTPLAVLRADLTDARLLLESVLQRRRLQPRWIAWLQQVAREDADVRQSDMYLLRFLPGISFVDLAVVARFIRPVGPAMMWALFVADTARAARLFAEWADAGDHERFRVLGGEFEKVFARCYRGPHFQMLSRVYDLMHEHHYTRPRIAGTP